jgi:hypothetical protein
MTTATTCSTRARINDSNIASFSSYVRGPVVVVLGTSLLVRPVLYIYQKNQQFKNRFQRLNRVREDFLVTPIPHTKTNRHAYANPGTTVKLQLRSFALN